MAWTGWTTTERVQAIIPDRVLTIAAGSEPTDAQVDEWIIEESLYVNSRVHENLSVPSDFTQATYDAWETANPVAFRLLRSVTEMIVAARCLQLKFPRDDEMSLQWRSLFERSEAMIATLETGSAEPGDGTDTKTQVASQQVDDDDYDIFNLTIDDY